jgi:hypothetical protein
MLRRPLASRVINGPSLGEGWFYGHASSQTFDMRYYRRHWEQSRSDEFNDWGTADYFFEADEDGAVLRQVEVYANGMILRYDRSHRGDRYGQLTDQPLDPTVLGAYTSDKAAFDAVWPPDMAAGPEPR